MFVVWFCLLGSGPRARPDGRGAGRAGGPRVRRVTAVHRPGTGPRAAARRGARRRRPPSAPPAGRRRAAISVIISSSITHTDTHDSLICFSLKYIRSHVRPHMSCVSPAKKTANNRIVIEQQPSQREHLSRSTVSTRAAREMAATRSTPRWREMARLDGRRHASMGAPRTSPPQVAPRSPQTWRSQSRAVRASGLGRGASAAPRHP